MDRIERAIRKWSKVTGGYVSDWAIKSWVTELTDRTEPEDKILDAMAYLVDRNRKPNLMELCKLLEEGLPRWWTDRQTMTDISTEGFQYFRMIAEAIDTPNHWQALRQCIEIGKQYAPNVDWSAAISECEKKISATDPKNDLDSSSEPPQDVDDPSSPDTTRGKLT